MYDRACTCSAGAWYSAHIRYLALPHLMNTTSPPPIRVLIADDHMLLREGIAAVLSHATDIEVVGQASNGQEAVEQYLCLQPDVTLMDLQMPLLNGVEAISAIHAH